MRIVHTESSCGWGGQEIRILTEAQGMIASGHDVLVACPPESKIFLESSRYGVPAVALPIARKGLRGLFALRKFLAESQAPINVVNAHSSTDTWLAALALKAMPPGPALVRTRHVSAPVPDNLSTRWLYRVASRMVVTTGRALRDELIKVNGLDPSRVISIPTGIDLAKFRPPEAAEHEAARARVGVSADAFVVGIVATLRSWKGHRYLIDAARDLKDALAPRRLVVLIVGDGPQERVLTEQIAALGLGDTVRLMGNQIDVVPFLHAFDAFALPSYANEGVPQALLQAMACGVPVVTTDAGAIGEIARHDTSALVVEKESATSLTHAIFRLAENPVLAARLADCARENVLAHYSLNAMLTQMSEVFEEASSARDPPAPS
jgi:glycosyltransferase involved in cell wall biosynthesis